MFDKTNFRIVLTMTIIITLLVQPQPVFSATFWSDDFNDGDLNGWDVKTYCASNPDTIPWELCNTLITNTNDQMRLEHTSVNVGGALNIAKHNSTILTGQWSFDFMSDEGGLVYFLFIYNDPEQDFVGYTYESPISYDAYGLQIYTSHSGNYSASGVSLVHYVEEFIVANQSNDLSYILADHNFANRTEELGNYHIDITRQNDGNMTVYVDSEKVMSALDNDITNSTQLAIFSVTYAVAVDNIVVLDEITITKPTTSISTPTDTSSSPPPTSTPTSTKDGTPLIYWFAIPVLLVLSRLSYKQRQKL